jgi:opacity protein-like surface antigen
MNFLRVLLAGGVVLTALPLHAVYAPVPEQEQGKSLVLSLKSGLVYDTNLFASASANVESSIFQLIPKAAYNASVTDQTFLSASYQLTFEHFDNRPGDKTLDSHEAMARVAHSFSPGTTLDVLDVFSVSRNPESLLNGLPVNSDQSLNRNELNVNLTTAPTAKATLVAKARSVSIDYRDASVGRGLDRFENLYGLSGSYAFLPEVKAVAEIRHQDVYYKKLGEIRNKSSDYLMAGADYAFAKKLTASGRLGSEWRHRDAEQSSTSPYAELSLKYDYTQDSFVSGGYVYTLEESSDITRFNDSKVNRGFVTVQHHLTALIVASGSVTYESSVLQGRRTVSNIDENTFRSGAALSYLPTKNWTVSGSYDYDQVNSDDRGRAYVRHRVGVSASYSF